MGKKYYTDQERYEFCRRFKISGKTQREFCIENHIMNICNLESTPIASFRAVKNSIVFASFRAPLSF